MAAAYKRVGVRLGEGSEHLLDELVRDRVGVRVGGRARARANAGAHLQRCIAHGLCVATAAAVARKVDGHLVRGRVWARTRVSGLAVWVRDRDRGSVWLIELGLGLGLGCWLGPQP